MSAGLTARNLCVKIAGKEILHGLNVDIRAGRRTAGRGRRGAAIWPVVAGGSWGWRLKMNRRPLISYPTAAKLTDQR